MLPQLPTNTSDFLSYARYPALKVHPINGVQFLEIDKTSFLEILPAMFVHYLLIDRSENDDSSVSLYCNNIL